jgi:hypothetical protein
MPEAFAKGPGGKGITPFDLPQPLRMGWAFAETRREIGFTQSAQRRGEAMPLPIAGRSFLTRWTGRGCRKRPAAGGRGADSLRLCGLCVRPFSRKRPFDCLPGRRSG